MGRVAGLEAPSRYHLAYIEWPGQIIVSTMHLTPLIAPGDGPPLYETMIFYPGDALDCQEWRCSTPEEALANHERAVDLVAARMNGRFFSDVMGRP